MWRSKRRYTFVPWHFLYFLPEPHGQGSLRPTFSPVTRGELPLVAAEAPALRAWLSSSCFLRWNSRSRASMVVEGARVAMGTACFAEASSAEPGA